jgi:cell fate (sporulation/competence/biofilm development) regulator YmcA (YheA/YmcA/DUF963 family)
MADNVSSKIVEIIKTHVNPKQGLANLSRNQNLAPAIVDIIKRSVPEAAKVVAHAPTNDVARAITKMIQNKVRIQPEIIAPLAANKPQVAAQVISQASANDVAQAITKLIQNKVRLSPNVVAPTVEKLTTEGNQTNELVQKILKAITTSPEVQRPTPTKPEGAIGEAYWAGVRKGWVFGSTSAPTFRLQGTPNLLDEHKGWRLRLRNDTSNKYNFYYTRPSPGQPPSFSGLRIRCLCSGRTSNQTF